MEKKIIFLPLGMNTLTHKNSGKIMCNAGFLCAVPFYRTLGIIISYYLIACVCFVVEMVKFILENKNYFTKQLQQDGCCFPVISVGCFPIQSTKITKWNIIIIQYVA